MTTAEERLKLIRYQHNYRLDTVRVLNEELAKLGKPPSHRLSNNDEAIAFLLAALASAETLRDGANERVRIVMDAKNHWQERAIALRPLLDASPLWVYRADDVGILACKHCDGMEEGDVFIHNPRCPWQVAKRSHDATTEPKH